MTHTAPKIKSSPLPVFAGIILGATFFGAAAVVFFFNPSAYGFYPICMFHELTGLNCPGCGGTRSLYALLHGNFQLAFKDNALFIFMLVAVAIRGVWFALRKISNKPTGHFFTSKMLWPLLVILFVFSVLRNLPAFSFLSP